MDFKCGECNLEEHWPYNELKHIGYNGWELCAYCEKQLCSECSNNHRC